MFEVSHSMNQLMISLILGPLYLQEHPSPVAVFENLPVVGSLWFDCRSHSGSGTPLRWQKVKN
uniref:Uncharacterized protein n=1 Tax=Arundo donax TaxID=35708 RepID=A0A0A9EXP5_ARUDO